MLIRRAIAFPKRLAPSQVDDFFISVVRRTGAVLGHRFASRQICWRYRIESQQTCAFCAAVCYHESVRNLSLKGRQKAGKLREI